VQTQWQAVKKEKHTYDKCVKNRCEPCHIRQVLEVVGAVHGVDDLDELATTLYANTCRVFFPDETV
jgi:TatD DNase family protein